MTGPSQVQRVLAVLRDGQPHTMREIHERAGTMRLNSRIAEIRKRFGLTIVCWRSGPDYVYQLVSAPLDGVEVSHASPLPSAPSSGAPLSERGSCYQPFGSLPNWLAPEAGIHAEGSTAAASPRSESGAPENPGSAKTANTRTHASGAGAPLQLPLEAA